MMGIYMSLSFAVWGVGGGGVAGERARARARWGDGTGD
jgi:hypothetical protein